MCGPFTAGERLYAIIKLLLLSPIPHILLIQTNLLKLEFFVLSTIGDIANFYMQHHLNIDDVLLSAVYLKELQARSSYPTLDQKSNTPFSIYIHTN